jgi:hypothetical protein
MRQSASAPEPDRAALNGRVRLIPPNDVDAAARELAAIARDRSERLDQGRTRVCALENCFARGGMRGGSSLPTMVRVLVVSPKWKRVARGKAGNRR